MYIAKTTALYAEWKPFVSNLTRRDDSLAGRKECCDTLRQDRKYSASRVRVFFLRCLLYTSPSPRD